MSWPPSWTPMTTRMTGSGATKNMDNMHSQGLSSHPLPLFLDVTGFHAHIYCVTISPFFNSIEYRISDNDFANVYRVRASGFHTIFTYFCSFISVCYIFEFYNYI
jgi:hypothetical protein